MIAEAVVARTENSGDSRDTIALLQREVSALEIRIRKTELRRKAMLHIMADLAESNRRLNSQRRAMLHILVDYEKDRRDLVQQSERLQNSRRALMHIVRDAHQANMRLSESRKAMIHIMGDLRQTTEEIRKREQELREKQEQLVQAGKLATLGELTTGVAHELNNPLNNIGLYVGNAIDLISMRRPDDPAVLEGLQHALEQLRKATEIINHLRTFGRAAPANREPVDVNEIMLRSLSLLSEQLRLREISVEVRLSERGPVAVANPIQLEQVVMNLLTNARDAVTCSPDKRILMSSLTEDHAVDIAIEDSGAGVPPELRQRIFDPFFTTKDVGDGTGLGLSIVYGIVKDHAGVITVHGSDLGGAKFVVSLPLSSQSPEVVAANG